MVVCGIMPNMLGNMDPAEKHCILSRIYHLQAVGEYR
jgi:hypothetical protein